MKNKYILLTISFVFFLVGCGSYEVGDIYNIDGQKGIILEVDDEGEPTLLLSIEEAVDLDADSALAWAATVGNGQWSLPTKDEMTLVRKYKSLINITLEDEKLPTILTDHTFYWTMTPCSESHVYACGPDGVKCYFKQNHSHCYRARSVIKLKN